MKVEQSLREVLQNREHPGWQQPQPWERGVGPPGGNLDLRLLASVTERKQAAQPRREHGEP